MENIEKQIEASMKQETIRRQSMTVNELFEHFSYVFDAVNYYDETTNVEDAARWDSGSDYDDFVAEYGKYNVISWSYTAFENELYLTIRKEKTENE